MPSFRRRQTGAFLQRARFLAISEFGPRSLIYHEGRAYRVIKAKLPPESRTADGQNLATRDITIVRFAARLMIARPRAATPATLPWQPRLPITRTLRIDNVEAAPTERITANDEERVRQGFEIQTVFSWPRKPRPCRGHRSSVKMENTQLITLQYANSAEISRINKGPETSS